MAGEELLGNTVFLVPDIPKRYELSGSVLPEGSGGTEVEAKVHAAIHAELRSVDQNRNAQNLCPLLSLDDCGG